MSDALLLDYNGVVVDDEPLHAEAFLATLAEEGIRLTVEAYYAEYLGLDDRACFREACRRAARPLSPGEVARLVGRKRERYLALASGSLPLVPGVAGFVREAARSRRVAIVSGAPRSEVSFGLAGAGLSEVVEEVVACDDVPTSKPDPAGFRLALARLAARYPGPWRAAVVEDSLPGLAAARAMGAGCLMLATSHPAAALAGADLVWLSFADHGPDEIEALFHPLPGIQA